MSDFYLYDSYETYTALMFVDPIFSVWFFTAAVSLVCVIVIRKRNGEHVLAANQSYKGPGDHWQQPSNSHVVGV